MISGHEGVCFPVSCCKSYLFGSRVIGFLDGRALRFVVLGDLPDRQMGRLLSSSDCGEPSNSLVRLFNAQEISKKSYSTPARDPKQCGG